MFYAGPDVVSVVGGDPKEFHVVAGSWGGSPGVALQPHSEHVAAVAEPGAAAYEEAVAEGVAACSALAVVPGATDHVEDFGDTLLNASNGPLPCTQ